METIPEQSKCEEMSISSTPSPENLRICLVGDCANDNAVLEAARTFGVPVITSENGSDMISESSSWTTYFILNSFEGPIFDEIHKANHRIMGPPALKQAAESKEGLVHSSRPLYNYSMRGVITCFTGIRKKDELTRLVNLIHSMGGSIRKDMNSKVTHLICNTSGGEKYQYAMTFRLTVVRSDWVYDAWNNKDIPNFKAIKDQFTKQYKLKAFEGQKICFFGFPPDEYQHMCEVLKDNGGIPTDLEDPDCTHVVMANNAEFFPDNIPSISPRVSPKSNETNLNKLVKSNHEINKDQISPEVELYTKSTSIMNESTPKSSRQDKTDGVILTKNDADNFINPNNLSPIFTTPKISLNFEENIILEESEENSSLSGESKYLKRKRDSFDNMSIISTDSFAQLNISIKKPKLTRAGSITKSLRRSMSLAVKTPIANMLRTRRSSVDPNASTCSFASIIDGGSHNESIKNPVKDKLLGIRDRITKNKKREINITPKVKSSNMGTLKKLCKLKSSNSKTTVELTPEKVCPETVDDLTDFKTPLAPSKYSLDPFNSYCIPSDLSSSTAIVNKFTIVPDNNNINLNHTNNLIGELLQCGAKMFDATLTASTTDVNGICTTNECDISLCPTVVHDNPVVDEHSTQKKPEPKNTKTPILKSDWFWYSIQNGYADEMDYLFGDYLNSMAHTPSADRRESLPVSFNKRKRKRFSQRLQLEGTPLGSGKRRSSVSDAGLLSVSGSFLDCTVSPEKQDVGSKTVLPENSIEVTPQKNKSMRYNHFMDFYYTESNYVGILDTILNFFKIPLEEKAESGEDALLNKSEVKSIFSNFIPIHEIHKQMLEKLKDLQKSWREDCSIGQIILEQRNELIKAYPPYVNFFEQMKETLIQCDNQNPRFHAFLKINQAKPECGRQTLQDLMIRPVQRLPSISLLLNDILKYTSKTNPDFCKLEEALKSIKEVMTHVNEDKRKTESQLAMFDIFNDIEGCPAHLVSSHRKFISKCEVTELSDSLSGRGDTLALYLFTDTIEVCKKRSKGFNSAKSPSTTKSFKHIKLMPLNTIKYVIEISDGPRAFALNCRQNQDSKDKLYSFAIEEDMDRNSYLKSLCKQIAENACQTDTDKSLITMTAQDLDVDINDVNLSTLSKAFKFATRTRLKVGRAFSFNKTPSKLKRAVSTMMPSPFGSTNSLTPSSHISSHIANMRLASCTNINEVGEEEHKNSPSNQSEILVAPMTVQPVRKIKASTISMAALRRI